MEAKLLNGTLSSRALRTTIQSELGSSLWLKEGNSFHFQFTVMKTLSHTHGSCKIHQQLLMMFLFLFSNVYLAY